MLRDSNFKCLPVHLGNTIYELMSDGKLAKGDFFIIWTIKEDIDLNIDDKERDFWV